MALFNPPLLPPQVDQEDEDDEPDIRDLFMGVGEGHSARVRRSRSPLIERVFGQSGSLTRGLVGRSSQEDFVQSKASFARHDPDEPERAPETRLGEFWVDLRSGGQMLVGALGNAIQTIGGSGQTIDRALGLDDLEAINLRDLADKPEIVESAAQALEEYGRQLRRQAESRREELAELSKGSGFIDFASRSIGEAAPLMAVGYAGFLTGGTVGAAGGPAGAVVSGIAGALGSIYFAEKNELQNELEADGLSEEDAAFYASLGGIPIAAAEAVLPGRGAARAISDPVRKALRQHLVGIAKEAGLGTVIEGTTEMIQENLGMLTRGIASGQWPSMDQWVERTLMAGAAGAIVGTTAGGAFGFIGEASQSARASVSQEQQKLAQAFAEDFDPSSVDPGFRVGNKVATEDSRGTIRWRNESGAFTEPPTPEEIETDFVNQLHNENLRQQALAVEERAQPVDIQVTEVADHIAEVSNLDVEPRITELNIRKLTRGYLKGSTIGRIREMRNEEIDTEIAELEAIAMDPSPEVGYGTRVTAIARARAIDRIRRNPPRESVEALDVSLAAEKFANLDDVTFESITEAAEADGLELQQRLVREARLIREVEDEFVESQADEVRARIDQAQTRRQRGVTVGSEVTTDRGVGEVIGVRPSGFLEVVFPEVEKPVIINPDNVDLVPQVGRPAQLFTGEVVDVLQVNDDNVRVRLPNGSETLVEPAQIERVGELSQSRVDLTETQAEQAQASQPEPVQTELIEPFSAVDSRTGQRVEVVALGPETAELADGQIVPRETLSPGGEVATLADIRNTGTVPSFEPGTQPRKGSHINFIRVPESISDAFERVLTGGNLDAETLNAFGDFFLLPQPPKPGTRLYAVELPEDNRTLTDASKRLLGFLGGRDVRINPQTLRARVEAQGELDPSEVRVMRVPEGLRSAVQGGGIANQLEGEDLRGYLRRQADLGFQMEAETAAALARAHQAAQAARDARISGQAGEAEVAEIETQVARAEVFQAELETEVQHLRQIWNAVQDELRAAMAPGERAAVDALHGIGEDRELILKEYLRALPGRIGDRQSDNWQLTFEHPDVPGLHLVVDKEIIPTAEDLGPRLSDDRLRKLLGGMQEVELPSGETVLRDPLTQISAEQWIEMRARHDLGERAVFHIRFITPEMQGIHARTIGTEENKVRVPQHLALGRGGQTGFSETPEAIRLINKGIAEGRTLDEIVEEMRSERREVRQVRLEGRDQLLAPDPETGRMTPVNDMSDEALSEIAPESIVSDATVYEVVDEREGVAVVEDPNTGERFEVPADQIVEEVGTDQESMREIRVPVRMTEDQVLDEVIREFRGFDRKTRIVAVGEWRSQIPGVYGAVRRSGPENHQVAIFEEPHTRQIRQPRLFEVKHLRNFPTREAAEAYLAEMDFRPATRPSRAAEYFQALPPVEELSGDILLEAQEGPVADLDNQTFDMIRAERVLTTRVLEFYHNRGYIPQPVRDYAVRFALRWHQLGLGRRLFNRSIRENLGIFDVGGTRRLAQTTDPRGLPSISAPDVRFEGGQIVVSKRTAAERANDVRLLDGILLDPSIEGTHPAKIQTAKVLYESNAHRERFMDMADISDLPPGERILERLVEIGDDRRLGVIVDPKLGSDEITVQTFQSGEPVMSTVSKKNVTRVRDPRKGLDYFRAAKDALGEITNMPKTPDMGASPLDAKMGLDLVQDRSAYIEGMRRYTDQVLTKVNVSEDGNLSGDVDQIDNLRDTWIRMKELDIPNRREGDELLIPEQMSLLLDNLAYHEIKNTFSNISPYGELMAKAKLGRLNRRQRRRLDRQAEQFNIDPDLPVWRKVEELIQNVWDPQTAHLLFQLRRDVGAAGFLEDYYDTDAGKAHGLDIRMPAMGSSIQTNVLSKWFTTPREFGYRHQTGRIFHYLAEKARTLSGNRTKEGVDIIKGLQAVGSGINLPRKKFLVEQLLTDESLGRFQKQPGVVLSREEVQEHMSDETYRALNEVDSEGTWDWYTPYKHIREILIEGRYDGIRNALIRGFKPERLTWNEEMSNKERQDFIQTTTEDLNLSPQEAADLRQRVQSGEPFWNLNRTSDPSTGKARDEVQVFINFLREYRSFEEIPQESRDSMADWMKDEFDFWARFGINNYAPRILRGHHKIYKKVEDGSDQLVGIAPDGEAFMRFQLRASRGDFIEEGINQGDEFYLEIGKPRSDELDWEFLGVERFSRMYAQLASRVGGREGLAAELARTATQALRVSSDPAVPRDLHFQPRKADLTDSIEDPFERILIYWARTQRNNFLLDIEHAYETARALDPHVSAANGVDAIFRSDRHGELGQESGMWYMKDLRDSFMGRTTERGKVANFIISVLTGIGRLKAGTVAKIKQKMSNDPNYDILSDPLFLDTMYDNDYAARRWAESATAVQSMIRLGFNFSGAAINATQHLMFTPSYLVARGATVPDAIKWSFQGYQDMLRYWRSVTPDRVELTAPTISGTGAGAALGAKIGLAGGPVGAAFGATLGASLGFAAARASGIGQDAVVGLPNPLKVVPDRGENAELARFAHDAGVAVVPARGIAGPSLGITGEATPMVFSDDPFTERFFKYTEYASMIPFAGAERTVRLASTFAARRFAKQRGLSRGAAVAFARDVVDNTQFQYYDQALPPFMRGNAARVLFQFKQFPMNAIKYEWDLLRASSPESTPIARAGNFQGRSRIIQPKTGKEVSAASQARKAWLLYNSTGLLFGGGAYFAARPMFAPLSWLAQLISGQTLSELMANFLGDGEDDYKETPGPLVGDPELMAAKDFMLHGIPGLLGVNISQRLGVSGLDFDPTRVTDLLFGPHGSMYSDSWTLLMGEDGFKNVNKPATILGFAAGELVRRRLGIRFPLAPIMTGMAGVQLGSLATGTSLRTFMRSEAGRRWVRSVTPGWYSGMGAAIDIFDDGDNEAVDANFQKRRYPGALNSNFEAAMQIAGFQTIRSSEERALMQYQYLKGASTRAKRMIYSSIGADLANEHGGVENEAVRQLIRESRDAGAGISEADIERVRELRQLGPIQRAREQLDLFLRLGGRAMPSGRP